MVQHLKNSLPFNKSLKIKSMTVVKFKQPVTKSFNNLVNDFFYGFPSILRDDVATPAFFQNVPVNIKETEEGYQLEIVAPGFNKQDFKVNIDKNLLTISAEVKTEEETKNEKFVRKEFTHQSFNRTFTLNEKIDGEKIDAKHVNGVLVINLQKKQEVKAPVKQITVE
jgi:HSP20 family protein